MSRSPNPPQKNLPLGVLCGAGAGALWGLVFLAPELARDFPPLDLAAGRYLAYGSSRCALSARDYPLCAAACVGATGMGSSGSRFSATASITSCSRWRCRKVASP
ncbi:hypothetical protein [Asaia platycodi]|uniref:hypothetical protein n=1 Tax=Asaia platycodi TaxID=610243 RepID=UPI0034E20717